MKNNYLNIYNNLVKLTRNKVLYKNIANNESFSDRLIIFFFHFAFFLKLFKKQTSKENLQNLYDSVNETYYHKENKELIDHYISNIDSINLFSYDHKNLSVNLLSKNLMFYIIYSMLLVLIFICILISSIFAYRFRNCSAFRRQYVSTVIFKNRFY